MRSFRNFFLILKLVLIVVILCTPIKTHAQTINVTGNNWNVIVPPITEAGTDYSGTYENTNNLTLSGNIPGSLLSLLSGGAVEVTVGYNPTTWHDGLKLYAKRTGGTTSITGICLLCSAPIDGDLSYTEISKTTATPLFTIKFLGPLGLINSVNYSDIQIQLQLSGISVTIPADNYSAEVVFTISAL